MNASLAGLTVLDLSRLVPGPFATSILAELGARVIKVEDPAGGDYARLLSGGAFDTMNRAKESVAINLKHADGVEIVRALARRSDVVFEGFRPGVADRLGVGFDALSKGNPRIVYAGVYGFGATGPSKDEPGHDLTYEALAGITAITGTREAPAMPAVPLADLAGGLYAVVAVLAALRERDATGRGKFLDLSLHDAALALNGMYLARAEAGDPLERGALELSGGLPGYNLYRTAQGDWIALAALEPKFLAKLEAIVGKPIETREDVEPFFASRSKRESLALLEKAGVPASAVLAPGEVLRDAHVRSRLPRGVPTPGSPLTHRAIDAPAPRVGEHTDRILAELGFDDAAIARLKREGAVA